MNPFYIKNVLLTTALTNLNQYSAFSNNHEGEDALNVEKRIFSLAKLFSFHIIIYSNFAVSDLHLITLS